MAKYRIYCDGNAVNTIVCDEAFCAEYCKANGYTYELMRDPEPVPDPEPTELEQLRADVDYIAMEMGVDL